MPWEVVKTHLGCFGSSAGNLHNGPWSLKEFVFFNPTQGILEARGHADAEKPSDGVEHSWNVGCCHKACACPLFTQSGSLVPETRTCQGQHTALSVTAQAVCVGSYFSPPSDPWFLGPHLPELFLSYTFKSYNQYYPVWWGHRTKPPNAAQTLSSSITNMCPVRVSCHMA